MTHTHTHTHDTHTHTHTHTHTQMQRLPAALLKRSSTNSVGGDADPAVAGVQNIYSNLQQAPTGTFVTA